MYIHMYIHRERERARIYGMLRFRRHARAVAGAARDGGRPTLRCSNNDDNNDNII